MEVKAKLSNLRIAPRKVRLVADVVRGKMVQRALDELSFVDNRSARPIAKLIKSAVANAKNNFQLNPDNLYISKLLVNEGSKLKRWRPRSRGQANEIIKRSSHIIIELKEKGKKTEKVETKTEKKIEKKEVVKKTKVKKVAPKKIIKKTTKKNVS